MTGKSSQELREEITTTFYGINPKTLHVESVTLSRGMMLQRWRGDANPSGFKIKGGRPPRSQVAAVFGLTDILSLSALEDYLVGSGDHPSVADLKDRAAGMRQAAYDLIGSADEAMTSRPEHIPVYAYHLLRRLALDEVDGRTLHGIADEDAVQFLLSRGLASREGGLLTITEAGKAIGEIDPDDPDQPEREH
jgi:hypothetical protein